MVFKNQRPFIIGEGIIGFSHPAFVNDTSIESVYFPSTFESIHESAFVNANNLKTVSFAEDSVLIFVFTFYP